MSSLKNLFSTPKKDKELERLQREQAARVREKERKETREFEGRRRNIRAARAGGGSLFPSLLASRQTGSLGGGP